MADHRISLADELSEYVEAQLETGFFASHSEFFATLIRTAQRENGPLRALLAEGGQGDLRDLPLDEIIERARSNIKSPAT